MILKIIVGVVLCLLIILSLFSENFNFLTIIKNFNELFVKEDLSSKKKYYIIDYIVFYLLPIMLSLLLSYLMKFSDTFTNNIIVANSVLTGLLFNLLILIFDTAITNKESIEESKKQIYITVVKEIYYIILHAIQISLFTILASLIYSTIYSSNNYTVLNYIFVFIILFLSIHFILVLFTAIKKIYIVLEKIISLK